MKKLVKASVKPSTFSQYSISLDAFNKFADDNRLDHTLPISSKNLGLFLTHLYEEGKSHSTIVGYSIAISFFHKMDNLNDPSDSELIKKLLTGIKKLNPPSDNRRAVKLETLELLLSHLCVLDLSNYDYVLYKAMFLFTYYGCLRVGEVAKASSVENVISINQVVCNFIDGRVNSLILKFVCYKHSDTMKNHRKSKNSLPSMKFTKKDDKSLCPVRAVFRYLKLRGSAKGQLFLNEEGDDVTYYQFNSMMKKCIVAANLPEENYGTHSFRIGRCTDLASLGYSNNQIKMIGRWKSDAYKRYIRPDVVHI